MPFCNKIDRKKVHGVEDFSASRKTYDNFIVYFTEKEEITPADYCFITISQGSTLAVARWPGATRN